MRDKENFCDSRNISSRDYELRAQNEDNIEDNYYKAYDKRYEQVYKTNMLWSSKECTPDVINTIRELQIKNKDRILDLGCGEGRDAIYLLSNNYNVIAIDYSKNVINKCNKLSNNKYIDKFKQFDLITDELNMKFDFIYSIAVLYMFVLEKHRDKYLKFIYKHLDDNGKALICVLGDGVQDYSSSIKGAFKNSQRTVLNNMTNINIAATTCRIVNWEFLKNEIEKNEFIIEKKWISQNIPEFKKSMCVIISKKKKGE